MQRCCLLIWIILLSGTGKSYSLYPVPDSLWCEQKIRVFKSKSTNWPSPWRTMKMLDHELLQCPEVNYMFI